MKTKWMAVMVLAAVLAGCAATDVPKRTVGERWNGGVWNSVLGYHGPDNAMAAPAGPSQ